MKWVLVSDRKVVGLVGIPLTPIKGVMAISEHDVACAPKVMRAMDAIKIIVDIERDHGEAIRLIRVALDRLAEETQ